MELTKNRNSKAIRKMAKNTKQIVVRIKLKHYKINQVKMYMILIG